MGLNIQDLFISSPAFEFGGRIPDRFASDKGNNQPELRIHGVPLGTRELAIICHDPIPRHLLGLLTGCCTAHRETQG